MWASASCEREIRQALIDALFAGEITTEAFERTEDAVCAGEHQREIHPTKVGYRTYPQPLSHAMLGQLYAHRDDESRFLLVRRDKTFPSEFHRAEWRVVAIGVEPATELIARELKQRWFSSYRQRPTY